MKKCASCIKDLPDAALHCVFCGAKQPPAPAAPQGLAKTVMGYSASEMIEQLKQGNARSGAPASAPPFNPTPAAALQFSPPQPAQPAPQYQAQPAPQYQAPPSRPSPAAASPSGGQQPFMGNNAATAYQQPSPFANPAPLAPASGANAKTVMAPAAPAYGSGPGPSAGGPNPGYGGPSSGPAYGASSGPNPGYGGPSNNPNQGYGTGGANALPHHVSPMMNAPAQVSPAAAIPAGYAGQTASREGRPIEPWKDSLRLVMLLWGAVLLAGFATPTSIDPLRGNWNTIIDGAGMAKVVPLVLAAVGLLSVIFSSVPMTPAPRGFVAAGLGLTGYILPFVLGLADGAPFVWQGLAALVAYMLLIPGLLVRAQYRDALLPRVLVTLGALAYLAIHLVPVSGGDVPLVAEFTKIIDAEGTGKVTAILDLFPLLVVVLSLLVWLPAPAPGGANLWAIILLVWPLVQHLVNVGLNIDTFPDAIKADPNSTVFGLWLYVIPYLAIQSFGFATLFGKQLE